jgi:glycosyltransferase involved in cell wall biosynthesis
LGISKFINFVGWQNDLTQFYDTHIAFIFPSIWVESFGLVITESMSHARAVIASNRGASPWLIDDNHTGLLFDPLQEGDLASKILHLANDTELAKFLGVNGFKKLNSFIDNDKNLQQIINIYQSVIQ